MTRPVVLCVAGTRPEILKLAPLVRLMRRPDSPVGVRTCFSGQHIELLASVLGDLDVEPDVDLRAPSSRGSLSHSLAWLLERLGAAVETIRPAGIIVQGDTNTVLAGALVGHHNKLPVFHVEAGLRTPDPMNPFPEEMNRRLVSQMASLHFAPTELSRQNLLQEGFDEETVILTGNTGIDTLHIYAGGEAPADARAVLNNMRPETRKILVTLHRRENAELVFEATHAVRDLVENFPDVEVMWILHLSSIRRRICQSLAGLKSVHLIEPQSYRNFVHLMKSSHFIMSDSGGVQEEAPTLGRPVLILRDNTERPEAVEAGNALLVGCHSSSILAGARRLLTEPAVYAHMSTPRSPFGDGRASERSLEALRRFYAGEINGRGKPTDPDTGPAHEANLSAR